MSNSFLLYSFAAALIGVDKGGIPGFAAVGMTIVLGLSVANQTRETGTGHLLALFAPILMLADVGAIYAYRNDIQRDIIKRMSGPIVVGMGVGFLLLGRLPDDYVKKATGTALLFLAIFFYITPLFQKSTQTTPRDSLLPTTSTTEIVIVSKSSLLNTAGKWAGSPLVVGFVVGVLTVIANVAGPIIAVYLIQLQLPKRQLNGTRALLFLLANFVKIPAQIILGNLDSTDLVLVIPLSAIAAVVTIFTEAYIIPHVEQKLFEKLSWLLVSFGALKLIFHG